MIAYRGFQPKIGYTPNKLDLGESMYSFVKECRYFTTSWSPSKCIDAFKCNLSPPNDTVSQPSTHKRKSFLFLSFQKKFTEHLVFVSIIISLLLHFVAFFHVASLFSTGVDNRKVGVDNKKALELTNSTVFHRGRQWKSSRADKQHCFP